jgi:16S rRNA (cytosine1402-N4)-methyltransferase
MENVGFYHTSVLLNEAIEGLSIREDGAYVDATFGGGGHSREILNRLGEKGKVFAFDHDEDAWKNKPDDERLVLVKENFRFMKRFLKLHGHPKVDGILADLGVSSHQFDTGERGFSIRFDGPLNMRMDKRQETTARDILMSYNEQALHKLFEQNGEVRNARQLAKHIVANRKTNTLNTIDSFKAMIAPVIIGNVNKYLAPVFQALRIEVNDEFGALKELLQQSADCLIEGGRLSIITFHSIEDRIVKQFIKNGSWEENEIDFLGNRKTISSLKAINNKPIEPTENETKNNPRARSARLRVAVKL